MYICASSQLHNMHTIVQILSVAWESNTATKSQRWLAQLILAVQATCPTPMTMKARNTAVMTTMPWSITGLDRPQLVTLNLNLTIEQQPARRHATAVCVGVHQHIPPSVPHKCVVKKRHAHNPFPMAESKKIHAAPPMPTRR